jgi:hypothetical protein
MSDHDPRLTVPDAVAPSPADTDPFGDRAELIRALVQSRRAWRAMLALGLLSISLGVALLAGGTGPLDAAGVALAALGIPLVVLADDRLARVFETAHATLPAEATPMSAGWFWTGGDGGGGFFDGGGCGGGDGGGGGC